MGLTELFLTAVGLSMDAFAVSICKGLAMKKSKLWQMAVVGLYFGFFQAAMPLIGYFVGGYFAAYITAYDHWIAFALLAYLGGKMIFDSFQKEDCEKCDCKNPLDVKDMLLMSVATSIDALAVGVTYALLTVDIIPAVSFIGITTFLFSFFGVKIGNLFGVRFKSKAEFFGGFILACIGIKILLEHLGVLEIIFGK